MVARRLHAPSGQPPTFGRVPIRVRGSASRGGLLRARAGALLGVVVGLLRLGRRRRRVDTGRRERPRAAFQVRKVTGCLGSGKSREGRPASAGSMNRRQISAGNDPPETEMPLTSPSGPGRGCSPSRRRLRGSACSRRTRRPRTRRSFPSCRRPAVERGAGAGAGADVVLEERVTTAATPSETTRVRRGPSPSGPRACHSGRRPSGSRSARCRSRRRQASRRRTPCRAGRRRPSRGPAGDLAVHLEQHPYAQPPCDGGDPPRGASSVSSAKTLLSERRVARSTDVQPT